MIGTWRDVNAPDTAWRAGNEDPIPVLLGRHPVTAFAYRFATGRPLDGHARTDATFLHAGTKARTVSGRTAAYNYWPGWKRGLLMTRLPAFGMLPYTVAVTGNEMLEHYQPMGHDGAQDWWMQWDTAAGIWVPLAALAGYKGVRFAQNYRFERQYLGPLRGALITTLRTREGVKLDIPRTLVGADTPGPTGRVFLPPAFVGSEDERENLIEVCRGRLSASALDGTFNMQGARPSMTLFVPPQPPEMVTWADMMAEWDADSPFLGYSAQGRVKWDLGESSPHIGVVGSTGSGKSELVAWIVAQFLRGGAGVVVLDPKGTSHRWLMDIPQVLYCGTPASLTDTVMSLAAELKRRADINLKSDRDQDFPRLVVLLEERNTMQDMLRQHWKETAPPGRRAEQAPAIGALAGLGAMGRSLNITLVMVGQETAKNEIGSKSNYGAWAIAGNMGPNHWRTVMGPGGKKPAMSTRPGSFGYVVGGQATVFQGAYPQLDTAKEVLHSARLTEWATSGDAPYDARELLQQVADAPMPSPDPVAADDVTQEYVTLSDMVTDGVTLTMLRTWRGRHADFPASVQTVGRTQFFDRAELAEYINDRMGAGDE